MNDIQVPDCLINDVREEQLSLPYQIQAKRSDTGVGLWQSRTAHACVGNHQILENFLATLSAKDSQSAASALIAEFGTISDVLAGSLSQLRRVVGPLLANAIDASRAVMRAALTELIPERPVISSSKAVLDYLRLEIAFLERERLIVLYLDHQARLIRIVSSDEGGTSHVSIDCARIVRDGLNLGAAGLILVHNHPSGDPHPSTADRQANSHLARVAADLGMPLIDHLIVARGKALSFGGLHSATEDNS